ncbi:unnamed protein product [Fraxinus pennsylvanica]|uniref:Ribosomal protein S9 n=1 Tax=Fraxinus pennsylvanica TaxID=56036 RepID=A0AAD1ZVU3_9LAMI|nr:unnamed protein product [Fraxinus pennsylvanica]
MLSRSPNLDNLIALKDFEGIQGLPLLRDIEDLCYEKNTRKSSRAEIELQKQEEVANSRVRQADDKGRAYGSGRRKCSIACVWIQPGEGKFEVNDKEFDVYFPILDYRAALLGLKLKLSLWVKSEPSVWASAERCKTGNQAYDVVSET